MFDSFQDQVIADFLSARNLNKSAYLQGWITDEELDAFQRKTLYKYAELLDDGMYMGFINASLFLLSEENDQNRINEEYGYMGRSL